MNLIDPAAPVIVYWRPGCPFCVGLRRDLRRAGVPTTDINIWADRQAADVVRAVANGNETVPTVVIGDTALVNPSAKTVLAALKPVRPDLVPDSATGSLSRRPDRPAVIRWTLIAMIVVASLIEEASGHPAASWALDGAAVAIYATSRFFGPGFGR